jgi:hypothetical protein
VCVSSADTNGCICVLAHSTQPVSRGSLKRRKNVTSCVTVTDSDEEHKTKGKQDLHQQLHLLRSTAGQTSTGLLQAHPSTSSRAIRHETNASSQVLCGIKREPQPR